MTIAVIIPVLNEEQLLPLTLSHTVHLGFAEIIVVDGGSQDRTREIAQTFAAAPAISHQPSAISVQPSASAPIRLLTAPAGRASQMNVGAAASQADVLLFLHADTQLPRDAKAAIERALEDPGTIGGRFDLRFERDAGLSRLVSRLMNVRSRLTGIATGDQAIFVRRAVFEQLGGFADIPIMEDVDFTRRLKRAGRLAALRSRVTTSYRRWDVCGPIRTILVMWMLRLLYWMGVSSHRLAHWYSAVR